MGKTFDPGKYNMSLKMRERKQCDVEDDAR